MSETLFARYEQGKRSFLEGRKEQLAVFAAEAAVSRELAGDPKLASWFHLVIEGWLYRSGLADVALSVHRLALEAAGKTGDNTILAVIWTQQGGALRASGDLDGAERAYREAVRLRRQQSSESLGLAGVLVMLGMTLATRGDAAGGEDAILTASRICERLSPDSLQTAMVLGMLGSMIAVERGDPGRARGWIEKSLAIMSKAAPGSLAEAGMVVSLANVMDATGQFEQAHSLYLRAARVSERLAPTGPFMVVCLNALGAIATRRNELAKAEDYFRRAIAIQEQSGQDANLAVSLSGLAGVLESRGDQDGAEAQLRKALALEQHRGPDTLGVAGILASLGMLWSRRGDLRGAEEPLQGALTIYQHVSPKGRGTAMILGALGLLRSQRGDLVGAEDFLKRSLEVYQVLAGGGLDVVATLRELATVAKTRGDVETAEAYLRQALRSSETQAPDSDHVASVLKALAGLARERGDLGAADAYLSRALEIAGRISSSSPDLVLTLVDAAALAERRGDLARAEALYRQALDVQEKAAPGSPLVSMILVGLAGVAERVGDRAEGERLLRPTLERATARGPASSETALVASALAGFAKARGDFSEAQSLYELALKSYEDTHTTPQAALTLAQLGDLALARGSYDEASRFFSKAVEIRERTGLVGSELALTLAGLAHSAMLRGDLASAERAYSRSVEISEKTAPGTERQAWVSYGLVTVLRAKGDKARAVDYCLKAMDALEAQRRRLGGAEETKAFFLAPFSGIYTGCIDLFLDVGHPGDALHTLERSRAQSFLALLAERDLRFAGDIPEELARERGFADAEYDKVLASLASAQAPSEAERLEGQLVRVRQKQQEIAQRIRATSPRLAALQYPEPLDLPGIQRVLDEGTVLLAYAVAKDRTFLFVVRADSPTAGAAVEPAVFRIPVGEEALRRKVEGMRRAIEAGLPSEDVAEDLYNILIRPAERLIEGGTRILFVPDGPLHVMPFAALVRKSDGSPQYLVEWRPFHVALSMTVYAELKGSRQPREGQCVVAFGDPRYPPAAGAEDTLNRDVRLARRRGLRFEPLPGTRQEVLAIKRLYGDRSRAYLGADATEDRARALDKSAGTIHFACHAWTDPDLPLNSGLALTIPEKPSEGAENGLLQAWEVFEYLSIDADLVTLSACETALGPEMRGEGLIGLTRAFHYAGTRSVLASLWKVPDEATSAVMREFYARLSAGQSKIEALRGAQISLIRPNPGIGQSRKDPARPDLSHPVHWGAFQLSGDWR